MILYPGNIRDCRMSAVRITSARTPAEAVR
ncbi:hypothetical protein R1CP_36340 (plasmid) [Rhodococcus opacus]|uniref:Uncharacterized protein n=1 Tax=Rhodococcus opacus TaxID=37919 RepID=A0A1B1KGZ7_RHOOP|nr:hypothetical protein R1CP_36340 [Rhodococcus opacus]